VSPSARLPRRPPLLGLVLLLAACGGTPDAPTDAGSASTPDGSSRDASIGLDRAEPADLGPRDAAPTPDAEPDAGAPDDAEIDAGSSDAEPDVDATLQPDAGPAADAAAPPDVGAPDAGSADASALDAGSDAGLDAGSPDAGPALCPAPSPVPTQACTDLTEHSLRARWSATSGDAARTTLSATTAAVMGSAALHVITESGFRFTLRYDAPAPMDTTGADTLQLVLRARNPNVGWQGPQPIVRLEDVTGRRLELTPPGILLPVDGRAWRSIAVPLDASGGWTLGGSIVDRSQIVGIELELDTWDYGFTLTLDAVAFRRAGVACLGGCPFDCSGRGVCDPGAVSCRCAPGTAGLGCERCGEGFEDDGAGGCRPTAASAAITEWPNALSGTNGDAWLRAHHGRIERLRPRVLVLDFVNTGTPTARRALIESIFAGFREGSRPLGAGGPRLDYQLAGWVDLRDGRLGRPNPPAGYPYQNSTLYPRRPPNTPANWSFDYAQLFDARFARLYGRPDPVTQRPRALCELVESGDIHELWVIGSADVPDVAAAEVLEHKQIHDAGGHPVPGAFDPCGGNGCFDRDVPVCGRSLRIGWVNHSRGPGCFLHSQGHGIETLGRGAAVPPVGEWFRSFAGLDLDRRYGLPFGDLYALVCPNPPCIAYPSPDRAELVHDGRPYTVRGWDPRCGNVHFPPNARQHYDDGNLAPVSASCDGFGRHGVACGVDARREVTSADWSANARFGDCGGPFLVWWYQRMPMFGSGQSFADRRPMPSIWPFLFY
jgi:hypothetical protein